MLESFQNYRDILQIIISNDCDVDLAGTFVTFQTRSKSTYSWLKITLLPCQRDKNLQGSSKHQTVRQVKHWPLCYFLNFDIGSITKYHVSGITLSWMFGSFQNFTKIFILHTNISHKCEGDLSETFVTFLTRSRSTPC